MRFLSALVTRKLDPELVHLASIVVVHHDHNWTFLLNSKSRIGGLACDHLKELLLFCGC